jgi:tripartite-type tricarboxylate transporter receptor subunit TctC
LLLSAIARCALIAAAINGGANAQTWPSHEIVVVSPFAGGTDYDVVARLVLDQVAREIGQPFELKNRPGGDGTDGVLSVARAAPDGYTLLLSTSAMVSAAILHKSLPYGALPVAGDRLLFEGSEDRSG